MAAFSEGWVQLSIGDKRCLRVPGFSRRLVALSISRALTLLIAALSISLVYLLAILPADALASVILAIALIAILSDALIAELSLGAVAIAGKLTLTFTAGMAAIVAPVLNRGTLVANAPLVDLATRETFFVVLVPGDAAVLTLLMVVTCHFEESPFLACGAAFRMSHGHCTPDPMGCKGCAMEGRVGLRSTSL